jgi:Histidine kinase-, DNA gyrase B-, and HSP90-like ATPase
MARNDGWNPIYLSAKVFGHLSQGLYRTPAGAIKELISNSFDADATLVRIHTGFPRFETFSCEDDGTGMSRDEFHRLMNRGIGSSYKRTSAASVTERYQRPLIGRLGLGILSLAQVCTSFEILSHHEGTETAFRATIQFPPYTRKEMDKIAKRVSDDKDDEQIHGGQYQITEEQYDSTKHGVRVFTKYLRESFRKRMRALQHFANKKTFGVTDPYKTFHNYLDAIYSPSKRVQSLNLLSDYDQLLFGLALAAPLPFIEDRNVVVQLPMILDRQTQLRKFKFQVQADNLSLANPICLPSDRENHNAKQCKLAGSETKSFRLLDGPAKESCSVIQHRVTVEGSDFQFNVYEILYSNENVAGSPLEFSGYLFQQTGRLYPRDIQGVLVRLSNVAIGRYDNSMLTYPYAEGPRYSMVSSELFVKRGFEDALNIDRDSFNELHPHYIRVQSYVHSLLHDLIFPETWSEEKVRNKARRDNVAKARESSFVERYRKTTGDTIRSIQRVEKRVKGHTSSAPRESPVEFHARRGQIEIDRTHPLLQPLFRRRKYAPLVEKVVLAFERANHEPNAPRRRELFYKLLSEIFADL